MIKSKDHKLFLFETFIIIHSEVHPPVVMATQRAQAGE